MPINNGRYVITGGYRSPDGIIVEERQYIPSTASAATSTPVGTVPPDVSSAVERSQVFTPAEVYKLQADGYANQGNNVMANAYGGIADNLGRYSSFANNSLNTADALLNYVKQNETGLQSTARGAYNTILGDLQKQRDYINNTFGPEGSLTKEVNAYYDDLGNYLATDAGRQAAEIAAQGMHSGASLGAIRAQQNEAYNQSFGRYVQAKEQQINAKLNIATNLINFMTNLRKEYGDTTNQYVIDLYKRANDLYNTIAQNTAADIDNYNKALATPTSGGGSSAQSSLSNELAQLITRGVSPEDAKKILEEKYGINLSSTESNGNNIETNNTAKQTSGQSKKPPSGGVGLGDVAQAMLYLNPAYVYARGNKWLSDRVSDIF